MTHAIRTFFSRYVEELRSSHLLMLLTGLLAVDFFVPDPLPFVDELVLGITTLLVARWKMRVRAELPDSDPSVEMKHLGGSDTTGLDQNGP